MCSEPVRVFYENGRPQLGNTGVNRAERRTLKHSFTVWQYGACANVEKVVDYSTLASDNTGPAIGNNVINRRLLFGNCQN